SSERILILAPQGRDAHIAAEILGGARLPTRVCPDLQCLCSDLAEGAAAVLVVEEALVAADISPLAQWIAEQPPWSDMPFVLLTPGGEGDREQPAKRLSQLLGNVSFLERPFHPATLISVVRTALRGRRRQYDARERIAQIREGEALLERRVVERTSE